MDYILKIDCNDEKGLILRVSEIVFKHGLNYVSTSEFVDHENRRFYMRAVVVGEVNTIEFKNTLSAYLPSDSVIFFESIKKKDIVILATKENHCLGDLLIKHSSGDLNANILIDSDFSSIYLQKLRFNWKNINRRYIQKYINYFRNINYFN